MNRKRAFEFLHQHMENRNLRRHCYAVEAVMRALARKFKVQNSKLKINGEEIDEEVWGIAGLIHDADYELTKDDPKEHTHKTVTWLKDLGADKRIIDAVLAHGWGFVEGNPEPRNKMEWSLYTCDELTGLIVAVALVKGGKLANVRVDSVLKKFPQKSFAAGVHRDQIKLCDEKLGIELAEFIGIALKAMQEIHEELGL